VARDQDGRRSLEPGLVVRLAALVLVPLLLSVWSSLTTIKHARDEAAAGRQVEQAIPTVNAMLDTSIALLAELAASSLVIELKGMPPSMAQIVNKIGFNADYPQLKRTTDVALARLDRLAPKDVQFERDLASLRTYVNSDKADPEVSFLYYEAADARMQARVSALTQALGRVGRLSSGNSKALDSVNVMADLGLAYHYRSSQLGEVGWVLLGSKRSPATLLTALGGATQLYQAASNRLSDSQAQHVSAEWQAVLDSQADKHFDSMVASASSGTGTPAGAPLDLTLQLGRDATTLQHSITKIITSNTVELRSLSQEMQRDAASTMRTTMIILLLSFLVVVAFALWVSRSIRHPLRDLAGNADAITEGRLDVHEVTARGPREIRVVIRAFNELVSNLRLLEAKSLALAGLDLAHPALSAPLPGRLGGAIDASVRALATSVSERDELGRQLAFDATHDTLTGLPNRAAATTALEGALPRARRAGTPVSVLFIDLDGFKRVNDTHGHQVGDQLLNTVAARMQEVAREGDTLARLGGDEFVIIAENTDAAGAAALGERIIAAVDAPILLDGLQLNVGASVGVTAALDAHESAAEVLRQADLALYRAKDAGRGRVALFDAFLQSELDQRNDVEQALQATLHRGGDELELHYQPVIDSASGRLTSTEALVRWNRPGHGQLAPAAFIPIAELSNLIVELDAWVLRTATVQGAVWQQAPHQPKLTLAVNISGRHLLSGQLVQHVFAALQSSGFPAANLVLEVTETVLITDLPSVSGHLDALRAAGIQIAIDDFGTGFTSLAALRALPVDIIKVDRSFVGQIDHAATRSLVNMVTQLGHELGVTIIAEGIETDAQRDTLHELGADQLQGFLISRPVTAEQISGQLANNSR
jgi:diguanylate cyclase (GGDEF)-like protein